MPGAFYMTIIYQMACGIEKEIEERYGHICNVIIRLDAYTNPTIEMTTPNDSFYMVIRFYPNAVFIPMDDHDDLIELEYNNPQMVDDIFEIIDGAITYQTVYK